MEFGKFGNEKSVTLIQPQQVLISINDALVLDKYTKN